MEFIHKDIGYLCDMQTVRSNMLRVKPAALSFSRKFCRCCHSVGRKACGIAFAFIIILGLHGSLLTKLIIIKYLGTY